MSNPVTLASHCFCKLGTETICRMFTWWIYSFVTRNTAGKCPSNTSAHQQCHQVVNRGNTDSGNIQSLHICGLQKHTMQTFWGFVLWQQVCSVSQLCLSLCIVPWKLCRQYLQHFCVVCVILAAIGGATGHKTTKRSRTSKWIHVTWPNFVKHTHTHTLSLVMACPASILCPYFFTFFLFSCWSQLNTAHVSHWWKSFLNSVISLVLSICMCFH